MRLVFTGVVFAMALPAIGYGNLPSAFFACEGAEDGEWCRKPGPIYGNCVRDTLCTDDETTEVDECLLCEDGCWGSEPGVVCLRPDGQFGVCEMQDNCTTDPEKSFQQCNRCVIGEIERTTPESAGCGENAILRGADTELGQDEAILGLLFIIAGSVLRRRS